MIDIVNTLLIQLINILPVFIPLILIVNLVCDLLWGER